MSLSAHVPIMWEESTGRGHRGKKVLAYWTDHFLIWLAVWHLPGLYPIVLGWGPLSTPRALVSTVAKACSWLNFVLLSGCWVLNLSGHLLLCFCKHRLSDSEQYFGKLHCKVPRWPKQPVFLEMLSEHRLAFHISKVPPCPESISTGWMDELGATPTPTMKGLSKSLLDTDHGHYLDGRTSPQWSTEYLTIR